MQKQFQQNMTYFPNGVQGLNKNCVFQAPGLEKKGGTTNLVTNANAFGMRCNGILSVAVGATSTFPVLGGGNLAFDNGTVPATTKSCRIYTFLGKVSSVDGSVTLSVINGADFTKQRPAWESDSNLDTVKNNATETIIGFLYVKNESSAVFIPGTTNLDASGITAIFTDAYGFVVG